MICKITNNIKYFLAIFTILLVSCANNSEIMRVRDNNDKFFYQNDKDKDVNEISYLQFNDNQENIYEKLLSIYKISDDKLLKFKDNKKINMRSSINEHINIQQRKLESKSELRHIKNELKQQFNEGSNILKVLLYGGILINGI